MSKIDSLLPDRKRWDRLRDNLIEIFTPLLFRKTVVYIDYPLHLNLGDLLIYKGTQELLKSLQCNIVESYSVRNADRLLSRQIPADWVLVLHGGGNFGDLYPVHQKLRENVVARFPHNPVLIMPQSVHFNNPESFSKGGEIFRQHEKLQMFVRDNESLQFMEQHLNKNQCRLAPDLATMLVGQWKWQEPAPENRLVFRRRDCESLQDQGDIASFFDWDSLYDNRDRLALKAVGKLSAMERRCNVLLGAATLWRYITNRLIERAVCYYEKYSTVDTDRLHGMILAQLMGKPVTLSDNSYQKIQRYVNCWLT